MEAHGVGGALARPAEPGRTLPTAAGAEYRALGPQRLVKRARMPRPTGGALLVGEGDRIFVLVELDRLVAGVLLVGVGAVAALVEGPEVPFGLAMDDHLGERLAGAARLTDAK